MTTLTENMKPVLTFHYGSDGRDSRLHTQSVPNSIWRGGLRGPWVCRTRGRGGTNQHFGPKTRGPHSDLGPSCPWNSSYLHREPGTHTSGTCWGPQTQSQQKLQFTTRSLGCCTCFPSNLRPSDGESVGRGDVSVAEHSTLWHNVCSSRGLCDIRQALQNNTVWRTTKSWPHNNNWQIVHTNNACDRTQALHSDFVQCLYEYKLHWAYSEVSHWLMCTEFRKREGQTPNL